ncbi:MAG: DUF3857 domain-containing protein [Terriglobales bacterium]|jgi:hypothetical protein
MLRIGTWAAIGLAVWMLADQQANAIGFQPVSPEELKMTSEPLAPGAPAIILYREVNRDDNGHTSHEDNYFRIKILTEEGRKYADVEIPFQKGANDVVNVYARSIRPDGTIANFDGKVFEKSLVKGRNFKYLAKTFTLPDVQVGSLIEYYFTYDYHEYALFDSHWVLSHELFTKSAKFSLKPYNGSYDNPWRIQWTWYNLPVGTKQPTEGADKVVRLEVQNIAAFPSEDYMPPENEMKARVDFIYNDEAFETDPDRFWKKYGKKHNDQLESFVNKRGAMEQAVAQTVAPGDSPEVKLQKIYARVQQLRNTTYEEQKTEQEKKRENEKNLSNVESVWKKQYGDGYELTWLFLGMARAAGFDAHGVMVSDRYNYFFNPKIMSAHRLDANVVVIKIDGKDVFFDPGAAFAPFGMLPWPETGVMGIKLDKDGGSWIKTTLPESAESRIQRKGEFKLTEEGDLEGTLTVTYTGLECLQRRVDQRLADDAARKKVLEDEVKASIPVGTEVELTNVPDWKTSAPTLVAEFSVKVPGWVSGAGHRAIMPVGLFGGSEKHLFDHADRVHPIYFEYPFQRVDDVSIVLPLGWQITSVPAPQKVDLHAVTYNLQADNDKGTLHLNRSLNVDIMLLDTKFYPTLRNFFQVVRTADELQAILQPSGTKASN